MLQFNLKVIAKITYVLTISCLQVFSATACMLEFKFKCSLRLEISLILLCSYVLYK